MIEAVGRALLNLDRLEEAEASFLDALELDPEWVGPRMGLAMVALRRDEPFKIVHHLERAIETDPEYPDAYVELGRYYGAMAEPPLPKLPSSAGRRATRRTQTCSLTPASPPSTPPTTPRRSTSSRRPLRQPW